MKKSTSFLCQVQLFTLLFLASFVQASTVLLEDDFSETKKLNEKLWKVFRTEGSYRPISDWTNQLKLVVSSEEPNQMVGMTSQQSDIDPFQLPIEVRVHGLGVEEVNLDGSGVSTFFLMVGAPDAVGQLSPSPDKVTAHYDRQKGALALLLHRKHSDVSVEVIDYGSEVEIHKFVLPGVPSDISWTIDSSGKDRQWSASFFGITTDSKKRFRINKQGSFKHYDDGTNSRLSLGGINYYGESFPTGTRYSLESVAVKAVETPSSIEAKNTVQDLRNAVDYMRNKKWSETKQPTLESLLDAPAGKHGFVVVNKSNKRLMFEDGTPADFFGVAHRHFANSSDAEPEEMVIMLNDLRALGVNQIRLQLFPEIVQRGGAGTLDTDVLDNLDRLISLAKVKGIYIHLNMTMSAVEKGIYETEISLEDEMLNKDILGLRKQYMAQLLTHVNPYTGIAYKNEPAIMALQLGNEMPVYSRAWAGKRTEGERGWQRMSPETREQIKPIWNEYLRDRYSSRIELEVAWQGSLDAKEDPYKGTVEVTNPFYPVQQHPNEKASVREVEATAFADYLLARYYQHMKDFIREKVGDRNHLISDNAWIRGSTGILEAAHNQLDLMDLQHYWPHLTYSRVPANNYNLSPLKDYGQLMLKSFLTARVSPDLRLTPFDVTEYSAHLDSGNPGEIYPVHSLFARVMGADGQMAWIYYDNESYWEHWFAFNMKYSSLPDRLIPFAASALIWRQRIPETDVRKLAKLYDNAKKMSKPELVTANIDRDGSLFEGTSIEDPNFSPNPELIQMNWDQGSMIVDEAAWSLYVGNGSFDGAKFKFIPNDLEKRYVIAAFSMDHSDFESTSRVRLFVNTPGRLVLGDWINNRRIFACGREWQAFREFNPVNGEILIEDVDRTFFYDFIDPRLETVFPETN